MSLSFLLDIPMRHPSDLQTCSFILRRYTSYPYRANSPVCAPGRSIVLDRGNSTSMEIVCFAFFSSTYVSLPSLWLFPGWIFSVYLWGSRWKEGWSASRGIIGSEKRVNVGRWSGISNILPVGQRSSQLNVKLPWPKEWKSGGGFPEKVVFKPLIPL